jgi:hypothetical protein
MSYAPLRRFKTLAEAQAYIHGCVDSTPPDEPLDINAPTNDLYAKKLERETERYIIFKEGDEFEVNYD